MHGKIIISTSVLFAGGVLFWAFGANSKPTVIKDPVRLINSIEGPALYKAYCAVCHGSDATGNGPMAQALKVPPRRFDSDCGAQRRGISDGARGTNHRGRGTASLRSWNQRNARCGVRSSLKSTGTRISDECGSII